MTEQLDNQEIPLLALPHSEQTSYRFHRNLHVKTSFEIEVHGVGQTSSRRMLNDLSIFRRIFQVNAVPVKIIFLNQTRRKLKN